MEDMIDTKTAFDELAKAMSTKGHPLTASDFYARPSVAKYYEVDKEGILFWNWECKIGLKDDSFAVRTNSFGIKNVNSILRHNFEHATGLRIYQILNSYNTYLSVKMRPVIKLLNKKENNPLN